MSYTLFWSLMSSLTAVPTKFFYLLTLTDRWRLPPRKRWPLLAILVAAAVSAQVICFHLFGIDARAKLIAGFVGITLADLIFFSLTPWRRGRALFLMLTAVVLSTICSTVVILLRLPYGPARLALKLGLNLLFALLGYWLFRPGLWNVLQLDAPVWYWLSLIPGLFTASFSVLLPYQFQSEQTYVLTPLLLLLCGLVLCTYMGFLLFFRILNAQYEAGCNEALLNALAHQTEAERRGMGRSQNTNADLARFLDQISDCLRLGDRAAALTLIRGMDTQLATHSGESRQFTSEPLLNAVLAYYAEWAEETGVTLAIQFQLPPHFELDHAGLAVVLSNALENAMHACMALPTNVPRTISLEARTTPEQFFLQIENTYAAPVEFDSSTGLPVTHEAGHGYGIKSITAFAAEHGGILQYGVSGELFRMRLLF